MQVNLTGRNLEVTAALKSFTLEKMQKIEHREHKIPRVDVILHLENADHVAEANLHFLGSDIHATAKASDMYNAIDLLVDKLVAQITKHKDKITGR